MIKKLSKPILSAFLFMLFIGIKPIFGQKVCEVDTLSNPCLKIFFVTDTLQADLKVCMVDSLFKVRKDGLWFMVTDPREAKFTYTVVSASRQADLKILTVVDPKNAGWINGSKRYLFKYAEKKNLLNTK